MASAACRREPVSSFSVTSDCLVGGRLWLQFPYSRVHTGGGMRGDCGYALVGGSASLTFIDWVEVTAATATAWEASQA